MMACDRIISPPPPKPCTARPAMSVNMLSPMPQMSEPTVNSANAAMNNGLRPMRSPSLP